MRSDESPVDEGAVPPDLSQTYETEEAEILHPEALGDIRRPLTMEVVGGPMDGYQCRVDGDALTIGRRRENDCALVLDPLVSGHHARIVREGGHFWLEDLDSRNGTFLGDHRIEDRMLIAPGAALTVGQTQLEFARTP